MNGVTTIASGRRDDGAQAGKRAPETVRVIVVAAMTQSHELSSSSHTFKNISM